MNKIKIGAVFMMISLCLAFLVGCSWLPSHRLPATPQGWTPGTEGWIPPLPRGMDNPHPLSQAEWDKVLKIANTDTEVVKQYEYNNIVSTTRFWEEYTGGAGSSYNSDSEILAGKAHLPTEYTWYYPAISFNYRNQVAMPGQGKSAGRMVGVDIKTNKRVYSFNEFVMPYKPHP